jgi:hypothetical protein
VRYAQVLIAFLVQTLVQRLLAHELVEAVAGIVVAHEEYLFGIMRHRRQAIFSGGVCFGKGLRRAGSTVFHHRIFIQTLDFQLVQLLQRHKGNGHLHHAGRIVVLVFVQLEAVLLEVRETLFVPINLGVNDLDIVLRWLVEQLLEGSRTGFH